MNLNDLRHVKLVGESATPDPDVAHDAARWRAALLLAAVFAVSLWLVKLLEELTGTSLIHLGVYPREWSGLIGVVCAPFVHGSWGHLISNTVPVLLLGTALLYGYPRSARIVVPALFLAVGLGVWLFARASYHVGASGLTFGVMFFVFTLGLLRRDRRAIALAMIVFFMYGGMVWGVFPGDPQISFESHLTGAIAGVGLALALRNLDPRPPEKRYSWELEGEDVEEAQWAERVDDAPMPRREGRLPAP